jgi:small multidrug resistance family-3 protein
MSVAKTLALFVVAAIAEIGGAWLVWQGTREHRGLVFVGAGIIALAAYGFIATLQDEHEFGRILAAYGGIFVAGSLAWGAVADGFRPDRFDLLGSALCLVGVGVIMFAPR